MKLLILVLSSLRGWKLELELCEWEMGVAGRDGAES
jgi:hypothetical protein